MGFAELFWFPTNKKCSVVPAAVAAPWTYLGHSVAAGELFPRPLHSSRL